LIGIKPERRPSGHRVTMHEEQGQSPNLNGEDDSLALARKVAFLSRPDSYQPVPEAVVARETHMSWVFMAGDRVYKLKKPVRFPYLDFSTLERRAEACRAEVILNARLAPDVYLGLAPLTLTSNGYAIGTSGRVADWLVVMRRLDETKTLEELLRARRVSPAHIQRLADNLHRFYAHASRSMTNPECYLATLKQATALDRHVLLNQAFDLNRGTVERIFNTQRRFLRQRRKLLTDRVRHRLILDGHGDLRPEHIWLTSPFPIIDCLEFNTRLRTLDALDELAFLHLECERLGARWVGEVLLRRLAIPLHDNPSSGLFLFYRISRAMLRARLAIAHMLDPKPRTPEKWPRLARTYFATARGDAMKLEQLLADHA
jgi:aminoglycoside phosphotransferase family enzyme